MLDYDKYQKNMFLRQCIPYVIMWNADKEYFILNRDYFFLFRKDQVDDIYNHLNPRGHPLDIVGREYLYDDSSPAYMNKTFFTKMCKKYTKTFIENKLKKCMNGPTLQNSHIKLL